MENSCTLGMQPTGQARVFPSRFCRITTSQSLESSHFCFTEIVFLPLSLRTFLIFGTTYSSIEWTNKIIWYDSKLTIRIYDISSIPTDNSPLHLLAKSEKPFKASYVDALSNDNIGVLVFESDINNDALYGKLRRDNPQYCGLNSTEYSEIAMEEVSNLTETFVDKMLEELKVLMGGTCVSIFLVRLTFACPPISFSRLSHSAQISPFPWLIIPPEINH
jgi:hypothetical protein